jgi:hypothetical protein
MRYSKAAYTNKHTVMIMRSAMMRSGFFRDRDEAHNWGSFKKRHPRSA